MDSGLMLEYVDYVNESRIDSGSETPMMMVYDSFRGHLEDSVKKKFRDNGIDLAVIPGGLTSVCQPLDVAINNIGKFFKGQICAVLRTAVLRRSANMPLRCKEKNYKNLRRSP